MARNSLEGFLNMTASCDDIHWRPQGKRMDKKYWKYVNFVGHMENFQSDAIRLLQSLTNGKSNAWDRYGQSGWGQSGTDSMFGSSTGRKHVTNADAKEKVYYNSLELEQRVEQFYQLDYLNPILNIPLVRFNE
jgi:hypothetical protein